MTVVLNCALGNITAVLLVACIAEVILVPAADKIILGNESCCFAAYFACRICIECRGIFSGVFGRVILVYNIVFKCRLEILSRISVLGKVIFGTQAYNSILYVTVESVL